jgi:hypothetical protein
MQLDASGWDTTYNAGGFQDPCYTTGASYDDMGYSDPSADYYHQSSQVFPGETGEYSSSESRSSTDGSTAGQGSSSSRPRNYCPIHDELHDLPRDVK